MPVDYFFVRGERRGHSATDGRKRRAVCVAASARSRAEGLATSNREKQPSARGRLRVADPFRDRCRSACRDTCFSRASARGGFGPPHLRAMRVQASAARSCGLPQKGDRRASPTASAKTSHRSSKNGIRAPGHSRRSAANPRRHRRRRAATASKRAGGNW